MLFCFQKSGRILGFFFPKVAKILDHVLARIGNILISRSSNIIPQFDVVFPPANNENSRKGFMLTDGKKVKLVGRLQLEFSYATMISKYNKPKFTITFQVVRGRKMARMRPLPGAVLFDIVATFLPKRKFG